MWEKKIKGNFKIAFIGAGRFGFFFGSLINQYEEVLFYDKIGNKKNFENFGTLEQCLQADFVFLTIPISEIESFIREHGAKIKPGAVVVDCASVKVSVLNWFKSSLPDGVEYVLTHPLFGPDSARKGLKGHQITMMPGRVAAVRYRFLVQLFEHKLGLLPLSMDAHEHDRLMAYNLSLIHHLGRALGDMDIFNVPLKMRGLSDLNRIAHFTMNDSDTLFKDFYRYNPYSHQIREKFEESFNKITKIFLN